MKTFSEIYIKLEARGESILFPLESPNWEYVKMELLAPCPQHVEEATAQSGRRSREMGKVWRREKEMRASENELQER